ncbi:MAG: hypothetical protein ACLPSL_04545 [Smithella sp.]
MTRRKLLRRVFILCCHCLRNLAFYRAGWSNGELILHNDFWITVNGNFMDICVLEWCKLFADPRGKHYWKKVISNLSVFSQGLLQELGISEQELCAYINEVRDYRDKFVAHLDQDEVMTPPVLEVIKNSTSCLYDFLLNHEDEGGYFTNAPAKSATLFLSSETQKAELVYGMGSGIRS